MLTGARRLCGAACVAWAAWGLSAHGQPPPVPTPAAAVAAADDWRVSPAAPGETLSTVRARMGKLLASVQTVKAEVELSRAEKDKKGKKSRRIKRGPMELARGRGARVALTRKDKTEEYIANASVLWSYEHKEKEAKYIPTGLPVVRDFVSSAMALDMILAMEPDTLRLVGSGVCEGEPCWVMEGSSPDDLALLGVPVVKMKAWVAKRDGLPRRISIPKEKDTMVLLRNIQVNVPVAAERFDWTAPKGVRTKNIFGF